MTPEARRQILSTIATLRALLAADEEGAAVERATVRELWDRYLLTLPKAEDEHWVRSMIAGHASLTTTARYISVTDKDVEEAHRLLEHATRRGPQRARSSEWRQASSDFTCANGNNRATP